MIPFAWRSYVYGVRPTVHMRVLFGFGVILIDSRDTTLVEKMIVTGHLPETPITYKEYYVIPVFPWDGKTA